MISAAAASISPTPRSPNAPATHFNGTAKDQSGEPGLPELVPDNAGLGTFRKSVQNRTLARWSALSVLGLAAFYQHGIKLSPGMRAAVLGLLFPGAGFIACANWVGAALGVLTVILLPVTLFAVCLCAMSLRTLTEDGVCLKR